MLAETASFPVQTQNGVPPGPWCWAQTWRNVFFAHWQVSAQALKPHLPAGLDVDTWQGAAWISAVAFHLDVEHRWLPSFGLASNFVELNLRTYVRWRDQPGIYFLSIHAGRRVSVALAHLLTPLPYVYAPLSYQQDGASWRLTCQQGSSSVLDAGFSTTDDEAPVAETSLDDWLLERYRLFAPCRRGGVQRLIVRHPHWQIKPVSGKVSARQLGAPFGVDLGRQPDALHFSTGVSALLWPFERVQ